MNEQGTRTAEQGTPSPRAAEKDYYLFTTLKLRPAGQGRAGNPALMRRWARRCPLSGRPLASRSVLLLAVDGGAGMGRPAPKEVLVEG